jgi:hypothetical protein
MNEIYSSCKDIESFNDIMGIVLTYYIVTRDPKIRSFSEIASIWYKSLYEPGVIRNQKKGETLEQVLERNIITEGFVTHSANGYNAKKIKKFGLGDKRIYDSKLAKDIMFLEEKVEKSKYLSGQSNVNSEIYYTSPGANSFHYACSFSPERLFLGPLRQERNSALPIIIGETKEEYMMRVAERKTSLLYEGKEKKEVLEAYKRVIMKLCTKPPVIIFIPIKSKKFQLKASNATFKNGQQIFLNEWIENHSYKHTVFFHVRKGEQVILTWET